MNFTRRAAVLAAATLTAAGVTGAPAHAVGDPRPDQYVVSTTEGENLEGIEVTRNGTMYVTSVKTGAVYRGDVRDDTLQPWLPAGSDGRTGATGVHVDRYGNVLVAGAATGCFYSYTTAGTLLTKHCVEGDSFLNDFSFTRDHVYITDSASDTIYRAEVTRDGVGPLQPFVTAADFSPATEFLNGIVTTAGDRYLVVSDWSTDRSYRVDIATGEVTPIAVEGDQALGADGLLLRGHTAYAVQTDWTTEQTWVRTVRFDRTFTSAKVVNDSPSVGFDQSPTTVAFDRGRMVWVDSQLNSADPTTPFTVSEVPGT